MLDKNTVATMAIDLMGGTPRRGDNERLIVSISKGGVYDEVLGNEMWERLSSISNPGRAIGVVDGDSTTMAFGIVSKMRENEYFTQWLAMATTTDKSIDSGVNIDVDNVIMVDVDRDASGMVTLDDILGNPSYDDYKEIARMLAPEGSEWREHVEAYIHYADGCRPYLGDDWYRDAIASLPFTAPEVLINMIAMKVHRAIEPCSSNPVSVAVYAVLTRKTKEETLAKMLADGI